MLLYFSKQIGFYIFYFIYIMGLFIFNIIGPYFTIYKSTLKIEIHINNLKLKSISLKYN